MSRILLVDDETNLRHTVGYALRREGHEVATAEDGEKGLEVAMVQNVAPGRPVLISGLS